MIGFSELTETPCKAHPGETVFFKINIKKKKKKKTKKH